MKKYLIVLVLGIVMLPHSIHAQEQELAKMKPAQKEKYLRDVATDVVKTYRIRQENG